MSFKTLLAALAVALVPAAASAVTFNNVDISGDFQCDPVLGAADTWGDIDVWQGASFNATFDNGDAGGNFCFNLNNNSTTDAAVTLAFATIKQGLNQFGFTGGVSVVSQSGTLWTVAEGENAANDFVFNMAPGEIVWFDFIFGEAYANGGTQPDIDFSVIAVVPVPAAGLLLLGGLGGLVVVKRRKKS